MQIISEAAQICDVLLLTHPNGYRDCLTTPWLVVSHKVMVFAFVGVAQI